MRLIWKAAKPISSGEATSSSTAVPDIALCQCQNRTTDKQLYQSFLTNGHSLLHWTGALGNPILQQVLSLYSRVPPIRYSVRALMSLSGVSCCRVSALASVDFAITEAQRFLQSSNESQKALDLVITMVMLSQIAIVLSQKTTSNGTDTETQHLLEILGGLDMNAWIVGRKTEPLHIWAKWCSGREGIETVSGLPRPLLDSIACLSMYQDVTEDLREFISELPRQEDMTTSVQRCFALTALLQSHNTIVPLTDADEIAASLQEAINNLRTEVNLGLFAWPAYTLGRYVGCSDARMRLVKGILGQIYSQTNDPFGFSGKAHTLLARNLGIGIGDGPEELQEEAMEVGLW
ncbi:C6 finger domain protein [Fusarium austroafricanum]|uniref:C6 finger domain protein n=1 Tax=Fusarium austroafricanum TaxID=2364996 RepID=A0A8H4KSK0_9HYPO|nr:C6 finger domain protein [Fusarium austroafricanum]